MTTEKTKAKRGRPKKVAATTATSSCDCSGKIAILESTIALQTSQIEVLAQYMKTFNVFLNQSMISNSVDGSAEEGLTQVMDNYPVS